MGASERGESGGGETGGRRSGRGRLWTSFSPPAYEDKQKLKRTEIISRSWFPSTPGASASSSSSKTNSVLKKLAQNRRATPTSSPVTMGHLGIVRRRSREVPESPQHPAETFKSGEPQLPEETIIVVVQSLSCVRL